MECRVSLLSTILAVVEILASPQTSFGVRLSRINECVTNEPKRDVCGEAIEIFDFTLVLNFLAFVVAGFQHGICT